MDSVTKKSGFGRRGVALGRRQPSETGRRNRVFGEFPIDSFSLPASWALSGPLTRQSHLLSGSLQRNNPLERLQEKLTEMTRSPWCPCPSRSFINFSRKTFTILRVRRFYVSAPHPSTLGFANKVIQIRPWVKIPYPQ